MVRSRQGLGSLLGAHTSIRTAAVALWGLRGLDLFLAARSSSGVGVCRGGVVFCAVVRASVRYCACALLGLRVARVARACCCACPGTHPLSGGPVWLHGGPCWRPAMARCAAVGCVHVGGGGVWILSSRFPRLVPLSPFAGLPCLPTLFVPTGLALAGRLVLVV